MTRLGDLLIVTSTTLHWTISIGIETPALYSVRMTFSRIVLLEKVNKENNLLGFLDVSGNQMSVPTNTVLPRQYHITDSLYLLPNEYVRPKKLLYPFAAAHTRSSATMQDRLDSQADAIVEMIGGTPFLATIHHQ